MAENGNCAHKGIMENKVVETRKFDQIVIRTRVCRKCGERVRTVELTDRNLENERRVSRQRLDKLTVEFKAEAQEIAQVMDAIKVLAKIGSAGDEKQRGD